MQIAAPQFQTSQCKAQLDTCRSRLMQLDARLETLKLRKKKLSVVYGLIAKLWIGLQNLLTGITSIISFAYPDQTTMKILTVISFVLSMALWSQMDKKAQEYLNSTNDIDRAQKCSQNVRNSLDNICEDGIIDQSERDQIMRLNGQLTDMSNELSTFSILIKIIGDAADDKEVRNALTDVSNMAVKFSRESQSQLARSQIPQQIIS